jgi:hypothetical protein
MIENRLAARSSVDRDSPIRTDYRADASMRRRVKSALGDSLKIYYITS